MNRYFKELFTGAKSLLKGLAVTFKAVVSSPVTVQYPRQKIDITPNYRGHTELIKDPETGTHKCIACGMCERECPSGCITLKGEKKEGVKGKVLVKYRLNFTTCCLCGACVETCPTGALAFSQAYNIAGFDKNEFHFDLLSRLEEGK
jgi:NADH-quinone oxidoreductase chain I